MLVHIKLRPRVLTICQDGPSVLKIIPSWALSGCWCEHMDLVHWCSLTNAHPPRPKLEFLVLAKQLVLASCHPVEAPGEGFSQQGAEALGSDVYEETCWEKICWVLVRILLKVTQTHLGKRGIFRVTEGSVE